MLYQPRALNRTRSYKGVLSRFVAFNWDPWLFSQIVLLLLMSFILIYSASGQNLAVMTRHAVHVVVGLAAFVLVAQQSPRTIKKWTPVLYAIGLAMLLGVLVLGYATKGAQRWINLGGFRFQPSECIKFTVPLMLAYYLSQQKGAFKLSTLGISLLIIGVPALLIAKQPDLGTALQVVATGCGVLFFAGLPWRWIVKIVIAAILGLPLLWWKLHAYQRKRVLTFLDPERDPLGSGYHIIQSKIAIGSGGWYGKGWCHGTQSQLKFLPESTTDFVFSVLGEEFGFVGVAILCLLYFAVIARATQMMTQTTDHFSRLLIGGIIFGFFACFFINIGMVSGLLPVVGCPLPFISYGGTSLVTWMAAFGMLMAIAAQQKYRTR